MHKRRILFVRWCDPLAHLVHAPKDDQEDDLEAVAARHSFMDEDEPHYNPDKGKVGAVGPSVIGPMGIIPLHEENLPGKLYNFWVGHTNFDLTRKVVDDIQAVPGVESLDVFTRYRFRMAVGKAFDQDDVKRAVQDRACPPAPGPAAAATALRSRFPHWAIYLTDGGKLEVAGGDTPEEVRARGLVGKEVARSW